MGLLTHRRSAYGCGTTLVSLTGITVDKASKLFFSKCGGAQARKSTERIRRVADLAKAGTSFGDPIELDGPEAPLQLVAHTSPLLILVQTLHGVSAVLAMPQTFALSGITKATDYATEVQVQSKGCTVGCRLLRCSVQHAEGGAGPLDIEDSTDVCYFSATSLARAGEVACKFSCCGLYVRPFNPSIEFDSEGNVKWAQFHYRTYGQCCKRYGRRWRAQVTLQHHCHGCLKQQR